MTLAGHDHGPTAATALSGWVVVESVVAVVLLGTGIGYLLALRSGRHCRPWPAHRAVLLVLGLACAGAGLVGPIARAGHASFTAHMLAHLLVGMIAPLLLVRAAPVTALLRGLPQQRARLLARALRSPYVRFIGHPVTAAVLNAGGLWVLYSTGLFPLMHASLTVHVLVHVHVFASGYLLTASIVGIDPDPHRAPFRLRAAVLIAFIAAHSILAKHLYAHPPAGVEAADARMGAQLMYYGGDAVDVVLIVLLFLGLHRARRARDTAPRLPSPTASR